MNGQEPEIEKPSLKQKRDAFKRQITMIVEDHPPMPLLPKSMNPGAEGVESGGAFNFLKLTKFRG